MSWIFLLWMGCSGGEALPELDPVVDGWTPEQRTTLQSLRLVTTPPPQPTNRYADDAAAAALGRDLFFDTGLSPSGTISCATCHDPEKGFGDGLALSVGVGSTERHAPAIPGNTAGTWFFWDGRADSLWAQAAGPIEAAAEMGGDRLFAVHWATTHHRDAYVTAFGEPPDLSDLPKRGKPDPGDPSGALNQAWQGLTPGQRDKATGVFVNLLKAIGAFERTLVAEETRFDTYVDAVLAGDARGGGHLTDLEVRGLGHFIGDANCVSCHLGPNFTDRAFHNLGLPEPDAKGYDQGRTRGAMLVAAGEFNCTSKWSDTQNCPELQFLNPTFQDFQSAFKTPSLRNVVHTAPYMHRGHFQTLEEVLSFYNELPGKPVAGHRELTLEPLELTEAETEELLAFLRALSTDNRSGSPLVQAPTED